MYHRVPEYPELEGTPKDEQSPIPDLFLQDVAFHLCQCKERSHPWAQGRSGGDGKKKKNGVWAGGVCQLQPQPK